MTSSRQNHLPTSTRLLVALSCLSTVACHASGMRNTELASAPISVPASERLYVASIGLTALERIHAAESQRLERLCPPSRPEGDTCIRRNVTSNRERVATLYSAPHGDSTPSAFINAFMNISPDDGTLRMGLDLESADRPRQFISWISDVGDWGYGIRIDGNVRTQGEWVQVLHPMLRGPAWMPKEALEPKAELYTYVDSIAGHILHVQPLEATNPSGVREVIEAGDFLITRVSPDAVEFRAEVESDYACGDDIPPPPVLPPLLRASHREFFNADGTPRFATKYAKGC